MIHPLSGSLTEVQAPEYATIHYLVINDTIQTLIIQIAILALTLEIALDDDVLLTTTILITITQVTMTIQLVTTVMTTHLNMTAQTKTVIPLTMMIILLKSIIQDLDPTAQDMIDPTTIVPFLENTVQARPNLTTQHTTSPTMIILLKKTIQRLNLTPQRKDMINPTMIVLLLQNTIQARPNPTTNPTRIILLKKTIQHPNLIS